MLCEADGRVGEDTCSTGDIPHVLNDCSLYQVDSKIVGREKQSIRAVQCKQHIPNIMLLKIFFQPVVPIMSRLSRALNQQKLVGVWQDCYVLGNVKLLRYSISVKGNLLHHSIYVKDY